MNISISERARNAAKRCKKKFACLKDQSTCCKVDDCINDSVLFVKSTYDAPCPYQQLFGNEFICNCPVRKELYDRHRI